MGLIERLFTLLFGEGRNLLRETAEVFRESAEGAAERQAGLRAEALAQYAAEFAVPRRGLFDRLMDGLNRLPRPLLAFGTIGLFIVAMADPVWFASRMQGIALVPEPLWWLMGAIVSFYFGARHQVHSQQFQKSIAETLARVPQVLESTARIEALRAPEPPEAPAAGRNPALEEWESTKA